MKKVCVKSVYNYRWWTKEEKDYIRENFLILGDKEMAKVINRTPSAITTKLFVLKLKRDKRSRKEIFKRLMSGENHHFYGKTFSKKYRKKLSKSRLKGLKDGRITVWNKGKKCPQMSLAKMGHLVSEESRKKISLANKGKRFSQKTEFKKNDQRIIGENNINWNNGSSFEVYPKKFKNVRGDILIRDRFICQECGVHKDKERIDIHHIDYDKKNNSLLNLICLCWSCHAKTNKKEDRIHWKNYFKMKMFIKTLFNPQNILVFNENKQLIGVSKI